MLKKMGLPEAFSASRIAVYLEVSPFEYMVSVVTKNVPRI